MANLRTAGKNLAYMLEYSKLDERLAGFLKGHDLDQVSNFHNFFEADPATEELRSEARDLAATAGVGNELGEWTDSLVKLYEVSSEGSHEGPRAHLHGQPGAAPHGVEGQEVPARTARYHRARPGLG